jgi:hypothetical protein
MCGVEDSLKRTEAQPQVLADQVLPVEAVGGAHHLANVGETG